jgi:hypothetical protein
MAKKIIKLTEGDIENIVKKVIEEQRPGDLGYGRKKRKKRKKDKTDRNSPNWKGSNSGNLNFEVMNLTPIAVNVTEYDFDVRYTSSLSRVGRSMPVIETPPEIMVTIPTYNVQGSSLPYADNMVMPYFDKYPEANVQFEKIVKDFIEYINAGGGDKLTNVTIKGSADSGAPTLKVPSGYSKLDHPSAKPYNGKTDPKEMNQYLADMRAKQYAQALINALKEETGFDLKIIVKKGDNFYGQGEGKRGEEFRKITLEPNAEQHEVKNTTETPGTVTTPKLQKGGGTPYIVTINMEGKPFETNETALGYRVIDSNGNIRLGISRELTEKLDLPIFNDKVSSEVKGQDFYVGGKLVGKIKPMSQRPVNFNSMFDKSTGKPRAFAGPISTVMAYRTHKINGEDVTISYLQDSYFVFF